MRAEQAKPASGGSSDTPVRKDGRALGAVRLILRGEGLLAVVVSTIAFAAIGGGWSQFALMFLLPDLTMLGYSFNRQIGATLYNCGHTYLAPAALGVLGYALGHQDLYPLALIWTAHIGFDRLLGYGLKYHDGFGSTHLNTLGR